MGNCYLCGKPTQSHRLGDYHICHTCWMERSHEVAALEQDIKKEMEKPLRELKKNEEAGIHLMSMVLDYATRFQEDFHQAAREYDGEVTEQTFPYFLNWFTFERELEDGATPAERFIGYYEMPDWVAAAVQRLQEPVRGFFEVTEQLDNDHFLVRRVRDGEEYTLYGHVDLKKGDMVGNDIYPWLDVYLTGGALAKYGEEEAQQIRRMTEQFKNLKEKTREMQRRLHDDFIDYFGRWDPLFPDEAKTRDILSAFMEWRDSDAAVPERAWDDGETALVSHPEHGITIIPGYGPFKDMLNSGDIDAPAARKALEQMPPWPLKELMDDEQLAAVINEAYDRDIDSSDVDAFMESVRDDWQADN